MSTQKEKALGKLGGDINRKFKEKKPEKQKVECDYIDLPPGCDTEWGRMMKRGEIKKAHIKMGDK